MSITKVLFIFFVAFIALGNCSVIKNDLNDDDDGDNVVVGIKSGALIFIETVVSVITDLGMNAINGLNDYSLVIQEKVRNLELILVDRLWDVIDNKLDDMENDSSDYTKTVIKCIKEQDDFLKTMVFNFTYQTVSCEIQKIIMNFNTYVPILTEISDTNEEMKNLTQQLIECGNDAAAMSCIDEIQDQMEAKLVESINILQDDIEVASNSRDSNAKFVAWCQRDAIYNFLKKLQELTAIQECIEENYPSNANV